MSIGEVLGEELMIKFCQNCRSRVQTSLHNSDVVHECNSGDLTLDEEDVLKLPGSYSDYDGSGEVASSALYAQGVGNELQGTDAGIACADFDGVTDRGNKATLYRQRKRLQTITFKEDC